MKVTLRNDFGFYQELPIKNSIYNVSNYHVYLNVIKELQVIKEITINNKIYPQQITDVVNIPCFFTVENNCVIQIKYDESIVRYTFKYINALAIDKKVYESLGDSYRKVKEVIGYERSSVEEIIKAIEEGKISLLHLLDPLTGLDDSDFLSDISDVLPLALDICSTPRQHLRVEEEVLDVALVKRINSNSLQYLSSHSEHWKGRTISSLIPARMLAQVYEDDIDIYENLFFKMVIDKILIYVGRKDEEVRKALTQKNNMIDWEEYGTILSDYRRGEILRKLMPQYDHDEEEYLRERFKELIGELEKIEKIVSSILSTSFYQKINKFKVIPLPVQPTNIIKMDNRYNELFKLWNKLLTIDLKEETKQSLTGATIEDVNNYYFLYVQIALVYAMHLIGFNINRDSYIQLSEDGASIIKIKAENSNFEIISDTTTIGKMTKCIKITLREKLHMAFEYQDLCDLETRIDEYDELFEIDKDFPGCIVFKKLPSKEQEKLISNIYKKSDLPEKEKKYKDKIWRQFLGDVLIKLSQPREYSICIVPILANIGEDEQDLKKYTDILLEGAKQCDLENTSIMFTLPMELQQFSKVNSQTLLSRLLSYGEAYVKEDAVRWGNYRVGMLPIAQTEINATQRLMKMLSIHLSRLTIQWGLDKRGCPLCGTENIEQIDQDTYKCKSNDCGIIWGHTTCSRGCHERFAWIRPAMELDSKAILADNELNRILKKESILDRLIITDFEFVKDGGRLKYIPRCPKCGMTNKMK